MDLSSLEGPPLQDERFTLSVSTPSPVSPVHTWERSRGLPPVPRIVTQMPISPLTDSSGHSVASRRYPDTYGWDNPRGFSRPIASPTPRRLRSSQSISISPESPTPLRGSRSYSNLQAPASVPPRPASADNQSRPAQMITNGRLIWLEEQEIWVLVDSLPAPAELPRAGNNNTYHVAQNSNNPLIQYYDPVAREYESEDELPPSYESHQFMSRRHLTIPPPTNQPHRRPHRGRDSGRGRTQWASIAERLGRSPFA